LAILVALVAILVVAATILEDTPAATLILLPGGWGACGRVGEFRHTPGGRVADPWCARVSSDSLWISSSL